jgi:alpha-glucosidase
VLGGTAWEWDEKTGQYYYHAFLKEQPDVNWRNPEVQEAMRGVMRFWLDKGIDGFRVDVMWHLLKDERYRDNPLNPDYAPSQPTYDRFVPVYSTDHPEVHDAVALLREQIDAYPEKVMIGEMYLPPDKVVDYYGYDNRGAHLPGNFQLLLTSWNAREIALGIDKYEGALPNRRLAQLGDRQP